MFLYPIHHDLEGPIPENLRELIKSAARPMGPLLHFHQFQTEYFRVDTGIMGIECDGVHRVVRPEDGEISVKAGSVHRFYIHPDSPGQMTVYLSASDSGMDYQLDRIFFENWFIGYWGSVALGRWIGGLLGYKPFFKEYTTDWDYAVAKMKGSWFQRHLVEESYSKAKTWEEQLALDCEKPQNAEYEQWTVDLDERNAKLANGSGGALLTNGDDGTPQMIRADSVVSGMDHVNGLKARLVRVAKE
ncbi:putative cupin -type protein [Neofusicoccum parvum UCRNP2]|uniref:Putative cupin-type protein n=1 Tax=Botryosphaeria parva (strain UCR-NP2) TaxID=1287680 RepID=R1EAI9_BOTPV|nr:putative cupin -type protein [Neofusicoccum parvum UCRNP2]